MSKVWETERHVLRVGDMQGKLIIDQLQICADQMALDEDPFTHHVPYAESLQAN
jgi:hypothetical protein